MGIESLQILLNLNDWFTYIFRMLQIWIEVNRLLSNQFVTAIT